MCRHLNLTNDLDSVDLYKCSLAKYNKKGTTILEFYSTIKWVALRKQTGNILAPNTLSDRLTGLFAISNFLGIDEIPPVF